MATGMLAHVLLPLPGAASWWLYSLSNVGLLSGTSTPVAMHFHKKGGNLIYNKEDLGYGFAHFLGVFLRKCTLKKRHVLYFLGTKT